jgi:DNA polymerase III subunit alpha
MSAPTFIHLTCRSSFSLLEGMVPTKKLAKALAAQGMPAAGVVELGNVFSAMDVTKYWPGLGVQPILGCALPVLAPIENLGQTTPIGHLTLLVQNEAGWRNLCRLVTLSQERKLTAGEPAATLDAVLTHHEGLIALSGPSVGGWAAVGLAQGQFASFMGPLQRVFEGRLYLEIQRHGLPDEPQLEAALLQHAQAHQLPIVATNDVRFLAADDLTAAEVLLGIGDGTTMDDPARRTLTPHHRLKSAAEMCATFADLPSACANTVAIAQRCAFVVPQIDVKSMFMPQWTFDGDTPVAEVIRREAEAGLQERLAQHVFPQCADEVARQAAETKYRTQLDYELGIISRMGFAGYFLITSDFIRWAKRHGIPVGPGRGSGAGSLVAWSLQITDLDPLRWELYFERFLNPDRVSLPDFDIDFCQDRREEVIAYVRERFGADKVAQIITFGSLKARACLRDVGRVLGLPYGFVGQIAALVPEGANPPPLDEVLKTDERLRERYDTEDDVRRLMDVARQLEGCYRHASTHAAGVIIADRPVADVCGLFVDPRALMPATQFSMGDAEAAGLVKFDFLGLKTLSIVRMAERLVQRHTPEFVLDAIPLDDQVTFQMLQTGATLGVFQIESAGMTELCKQMKATDLEALSALIALYRPGPMELIPQYLSVRLGKAAADYPHPLLKPVLEVTFGIAVYQEQVMQMARVLAGYSLGAADMLRRAMGKKKPEEMAKERVKFVEGAAAVNQVPAEDAHRIFGLMETFAGYGFNKAHSMAYALISYQTAYLKARHPREFMAAVLTYDRGNTDKLMEYQPELQTMKLALAGPSVNHAQVMFAVEGAGLRYALAALKGVGEDAMQQLVQARGGKPFASVWDMLARVPPSALTRRQLEALIKAGALDELEPNRAWLLANVETLLAYGAACVEAKESGQGSLFGGNDGPPDPNPFLQGCKTTPPWPHLQQLQHEAEAVGFYLSSHPLAAIQPELDRLAKQLGGFKALSDIAAYAQQGGGPARVAALVTGIREVKTKKGSRMGILTLSDASGQTEAACFPELYATHHVVLSQPQQPVLFALKVGMDGERLRCTVESLRPLAEAMAERAELVLTLPTTCTLAQLQATLASTPPGPTRVSVRMLVQPHGMARVRLPQGIRCQPDVLANLQGLGVGIA